MNESQALTANQLRAILKKAGEHGVQVKVNDKDLRTVPHKAKLVSIINDRTAVIKPHGHGHVEQCSIDQIRFWKAGNIHMPEIETILESSLFLDKEGLGGLSKSPVGKFCVISRSLKRAWCGRKIQWRDNPQLAVVWEDYSSAAKAVGKLKDTPLTKDAEVVTKNECFAFIGSVIPRPAVTKTEPEPKPEPAPVIIKKEEPVIEAPEKKNDVDIASLLGMDIDSMLEDDDELLQRAIGNRRELAHKVKLVQDQLSLVLGQLKKADDTFQELFAKISGRKSAAKPAGRRTYGERGLLKGTIVSVLKSNPSLPLEVLVQKVRGAEPSLKEENIKKCVYTLVAKNVVIRNNNNISLVRTGEQD